MKLKLTDFQDNVVVGESIRPTFRGFCLETDCTSLLFSLSLLSFTVDPLPLGLAAPLLLLGTVSDVQAAILFSSVSAIALAFSVEADSLGEEFWAAVAIEDLFCEFIQSFGLRRDLTETH